ncbi:MAG: cytidine deaminase [Caulobacteraceae bacterium]
MTEDDLLNAARAARKSAYAPYSGFRVGAAVLDAEGRIHAGCNVENAAYPEGVCAEGGAISAMALAGGRAIRFVAISAGPGEELKACLPCGGCRQKILEFAGEGAQVLIDGPSGVERYRFADLMPPRLRTRRPRPLDRAESRRRAAGAGLAVAVAG